jgi:hypothetical protein
MTIHRDAKIHVKTKELADLKNQVSKLEGCQVSRKREYNEAQKALSAAASEFQSTSTVKQLDKLKSGYI